MKIKPKKKSIQEKINVNILSILIPSLLILIVVSCIFSATAITRLNKNVLESQSNNAVMIVDDFFNSKIAAVSMLQNNSEIQNILTEAKTVKQLETNVNKNNVVDILSNIYDLMLDEGVQATWVAGKENGSYLMYTGEIADTKYDTIDWDDKILSSKKTIVSEPFMDPVSNKMVVSVVSPVFSSNGSEIVGFAGFDVFQDNLGERLADIKIGKNGFLDLISNNLTYIYSEDTEVINKNINNVDISNEFIQKASVDYEGELTYIYAKTPYNSIFKISDTTGWLAVANIPLKEVNSTRNQLIVVLVVLSVVILSILVISLILSVKKLISPLKQLTENVQDFSHGNLNIDINVNTNDEIGILADSVKLTISTLKNIIYDISFNLSEISKGNLTLSVDNDYIGDFLPIKEALNNIIASLNNTLSQINESADQVSSGSEQVSVGAQALSQGSTEQASSVEELAATINEISGQININAEKAIHANERASAVGIEAKESNARMQNMLRSMAEINNSSNEIGKIIKTIEDIAFQTNILALNAAIEAARAGMAGKGFAVVADEVGNLASKSAEASKNTAVLIENSLNAVQNGIKTADETAESLSSVLKGANEVTTTINDISSAFVTQAEAISQVTLGIDQISSVVQTNSATAEESAAASEELSGQAQILKGLVGKFKIKDTKNNFNYNAIRNKNIENNFNYNEIKNENTEDNFNYNEIKNENTQDNFNKNKASDVGEILDIDKY